MCMSSLYSPIAGCWRCPACGGLGARPASGCDTPRCWSGTCRTAHAGYLHARNAILTGKCCPPSKSIADFWLCRYREQECLVFSAADTCTAHANWCSPILTQCSRARLPRVPAAGMRTAAQCCGVRAPDEWLLPVYICMSYQVEVWLSTPGDNDRLTGAHRMSTCAGHHQAHFSEVVLDEVMSVPACSPVSANDFENRRFSRAFTCAIIECSP